MSIKAIIGLITLISFINCGKATKMWTYDLKDIKCTSTDPEKLKFDLKIERVSRGVFAISGTFVLNLDFTVDDGNLVGANSFRSITGSDDNYKAMPFHISPDHWYKIINSHYKNVLMDTMKDCSDLPTFEDKFQPPLEKKTYTLTKCQINQDGLPNHLQEGFYKVVIYGKGDVDWEIAVTAEVMPDI